MHRHTLVSLSLSLIYARREILNAFYYETPRSTNWNYYCYEKMLSIAQMHSIEKILTCVQLWWMFNFFSHLPPCLCCLFVCICTAETGARVYMLIKRLVKRKREILPCIS